MAASYKILPDTSPNGFRHPMKSNLHSNSLMFHPNLSDLSCQRSPLQTNWPFLQIWQETLMLVCQIKEVCMPTLEVTSVSSGFGIHFNLKLFSDKQVSRGCTVDKFDRRNEDCTFWLSV
uniref:Uncharacterized protein n=1 Tax=Schistocephalus solidus TaxID=70667 RepID=A0A0X3P0F6_SCHSO